MIRSFALTLSAISLRMWKVVLAHCTDLPPMDRYSIALARLDLKPADRGMDHLQVLFTEKI